MHKMQKFILWQAKWTIIGNVESKCLFHIQNFVALNTLNSDECFHDQFAQYRVEGYNFIDIISSCIVAIQILIGCLLRR